MFTGFDKLIAAVLAPTLTTFVTTALAPAGINGSTTLSQALSIAIGALMVWLVPNKPAAPSAK